MDALIKRLLRTGARRGFQGSNAWAIVAVVAGALNILRRLAHPKPEVVWRQQLGPDDRFEVTVVSARPKAAKS